MTRSQRLIILIFLPSMAWLMHTSYCDWEWDTPLNTGPPFPKLDIYGIRHFKPGTGYTVRGLMNGAAISRESAILYGVVVPLSLMACWVYMVIGWRHQARIARGLCANCGYDLRGNNCSAEAKCPECGKATLRRTR